MSGRHRAAVERPTRIPHTLVGVALALGALAGQAGAGHVAELVSPAHDVRPVVVNDHGDQPLHEDDPGWDCHTMGNMICGPGFG